MDDSGQNLFDFASGDKCGYQNWRREHQQRLQVIRREWGIPVRRRLRLRLKNLNGDFEGVLRLVAQPLTIDRRRPLHLKIDKIDVFPNQIEQCVLIDHPHTTVP